MIGSLTSLEQIHLNAGDQYGSRHNWLIDHELMREHLGKLPNQKNIAFSRDSYNFDGLSRWEVEYYYQPGHRSEVRMRIWEQTHRKRITAQVVLYMEAANYLEWIYIGQLPFQCRRGLTKDAIPNLAIPALKRNSDCLYLLAYLQRRKIKKRLPQPLLLF